MALNVDQNYQTVVNVIREHGKPNPSFPSDLDINYSVLSKNCTFGGLGAVLKNMKKKKMVDFSDNGIFKDNSVITLIGDYNAEAVAGGGQQITYDQIGDKIKGESTSHQKGNYGTTAN
eukprot:TRINITY_DN1985_c0_g1_i1.p1 TRINITY_DN1985_c0_g1~~TRINITY_DN1985_c0_g1_i1.p1  ORF type:complete len:118 (+),score=31.59 TRINITY_DN1985_c0_g1_i1:132-485(+)